MLLHAEKTAAGGREWMLVEPGFVVHGEYLDLNLSSSGNYIGLAVYTLVMARQTVDMGRQIIYFKG